MKNSRDDKGHYDQLTKMRERRIAMEADKIKVPTLIIWGRHDKSVSWKMVNCIMGYLRIARSILLKRIPCTVSPGTNRVYGICTSVLREESTMIKF